MAEIERLKEIEAAAIEFDALFDLSSTFADGENTVAFTCSGPVNSAMARLRAALSAHSEE